ncbi:hypothetical protein CTA2_7769, partial [Colletotrichum tanaceti]
SAGNIVICYFNGGSVQDWDEDLDAFPVGVIGLPLNPPYTDKRYLGVRDARVVNLIKRRPERAADIGCDGVDPDNIDAWAELTTASSRPLFLSQKNAPTIAPQLSFVADFAVLETRLCTRTSDVVEPFCADFQPYVEAGKPVFQIEYPTSVRDDTDIDQADYDLFCVDKNGNEGFSEVLKHASEQVDGWGQFCGLGRTGGRFETPIVDEDEG